MESAHRLINKWLTVTGIHTKGGTPLLVGRELECPLCSSSPKGWGVMRGHPQSFTKLLWANQGPSHYLQSPSPLLHGLPFYFSKTITARTCQCSLTSQPPPSGCDHIPRLSHALHFPAQKPYTAPHNSPNSLPTIYRQPTLLNYLLFSPSAHSKSIRHTVSELLSSEPGWGQGES